MRWSAAGPMLAPPQLSSAYVSVPSWLMPPIETMFFDQACGRELCEFAGSIERQGTQGVSITETVNSLAAAMRAKALDELEREADRANANLSGPTIGFVVATMVFLAYPLAVRIGDRDGGLVNQAMLRRAGRSAPGTRSTRL